MKKTNEKVSHIPVNCL